jgi:hypothetical protein
MVVIVSASIIIPSCVGLGTIEVLAIGCRNRCVRIMDVVP